MNGLGVADSLVVGPGNVIVTLCHFLSSPATLAAVPSVGDSGVLGFTPFGELRMQTIAHSPVGYAIEAGVLDELEAMLHADRHLVSNVIGDPHMHVELSSALELESGDTYVIASDGLFDNIHTPEIVRYLHKGSLSQSTRQLVEECRRRMLQPTEGQPSKPDDLTLIAFRPRIL